jgi:hypothetical protein
LLSEFQDFKWEKVANRKGKPVHFADTVQQSPVKVGETFLPNRLLLDKNRYQIGRIRTIGDDKQLCIRVMAILPNGERKPMKVLIDTGAEVNLIKLGLFPSEHFLHLEAR